ncbi:MAG TPA: VOC family protein [Allosphingosinicella sp.]|nr:VOC family protein [Allosphingosinicella sp.]
MPAGGGTGFPPPPFAPERLDHLLLIVDDLAAAERFYCGVIGCTVAARLPRHAMVELRAGESALDLVDISAAEGVWARPVREGGRNLDHFCLATGPWDEPAMRDHLARHDVAIVEERREEGPDGESLSFYLRDPTGNVVELMRPPLSPAAPPPKP